MRYILVLILAFLVAGIYFFRNSTAMVQVCEKKITPIEPYEEFMLQRTYPNKLFDFKAYQNALNDAVNREINQRSKKSNVSWTLEGPGNIGGRFNCLAVSPVNSSVMYAGSANGGVWKTTDNGTNWFPIFDSIPYLAIGAIAINPNNDNEIWVGTGDVNISGTMYSGNGLYKSLDEGQTWAYLGLPDSYVISCIVFNNANANEVLVGTMGNPFARDNNRGMYRTTNGGTSFSLTKFINDSTGIIDMVQDPTNPSIVYASSFSRIRTESVSLIYGTEVYVFKSTDFGQTWNTLSGGLPNGNMHERLGLAICKSSPSILYALYSTSDGMTPELYKTTNAGQTWSQVFIGLFDVGSYGTYGWYFGKIYVDPNDANTVYMPGVDLLYSTDGGANWDLRTPPWFLYEVHADGHYMHFNTSTDIIYCNDGGMNRTLDGGNTWTDIENIPNNQFYSVTENQNNIGEYAGGVQDNGTMIGNSFVFNNFSRLYGGDGFTVTFTQNPSLVYSESQNGNIVYDDDHPNANWNTLDVEPGENYNWHTPYIVSHFSDDTVYLAGQTVQRVDGAPYGLHTVISPVLNDISSPERVSNISTINQSPLRREVLYAGTADGKVWNTLDGGNNWNDVTPFTGMRYYITRVMPSPNDSNRAYVTRSGYRSNDNTPLVFMTNDNGTNWSNVSGDLPMLAVNDILVYPGDENILFVATDGGVYTSTNGGIHWQRVGDNMPFVAVLDIHFNHDKSKIIAGTFGRSMYSIDISHIITSTFTAESEIELLLYPNPTSDKLTIKTSQRIDAVRIFEMNGELLIDSKSSTVDVSDFPAALYFIKVTSGTREYVRQFIKYN